MGKYSPVSSVIERIERKMAEGRKLRAKLGKLVFQLGKRQEQTPLEREKGKDLIIGFGATGEI